MSVFVKLESLHELYDETAIIELQGNLECRSNSKLVSQFIGDLYFKSQSDGSVLPVLIIGHHILNGRIQNLDHPLIVMKQEKENTDNLTYKIKTIVTKKISFKIRPKPIIVNN